MTVKLKIGILSFVMSGLLILPALPELFGQAQKTMVVIDKRDVEIEITQWVIRPSSKPDELVVEKENSTARYAWGKIEKIEISRDLSSQKDSRYCSLKITMRNGGVVQARLHYPEHYIEGRLPNGNMFSLDFCLAKTIRFK